MLPYAEVIGDPVAHSRSPAIHRFWLKALSVEGDYRATSVDREGLAAFLRRRRGDDLWRGCNITAPCKEAVLPLIDDIDEEARAVGAVNCLRREGGRLIGSNTDVDGIAEALRGVALAGERIAIIGGGGAARAVLHHALRERAASVVLLLRSSAKGARLAELGTKATRIECLPLDQIVRAAAGAAVLINATPLGTTGGQMLPGIVLDAAASTSIAFDMVYEPVRTQFLTAAADGGARTVDGLVMLIGQARRAFRLFFGEEPPRGDDSRLRDHLMGASAV